MIRFVASLCRLVVLAAAFGIQQPATAQLSGAPMQPVIETPLQVDDRGFVIVGRGQNDFARACEKAAAENLAGVFVPRWPNASYPLSRKIHIENWIGGQIIGTGNWSLVNQQSMNAYIEAVNCHDLRIDGLTFQTGAMKPGGGGFTATARAAVVLARGPEGKSANGVDITERVIFRGNYTTACVVDLACEITRFDFKGFNYYETGGVLILDSQDRYGLGFEQDSASPLWTCSAHRVNIDGAAYGDRGFGLLISGHTSDVHGSLYLQASGVSARVRIVSQPLIGTRGSVPGQIGLDVYGHGPSPRTLSVWSDSRPLIGVEVRNQRHELQPLGDTRAEELNELVKWLAQEPGI